jgi:hypothetical protein
MEFLRRYLAKAADVEMKLIARKREFLKLISLGRVLLSGLPVGPHNQGKRPREKIKKEDILPGISMSFDGYLTDAGGWTLYQDLSVQLDDVRRAYPFGLIGPLDPSFLKEAAISAAPVEQGLRKRHAGGRPQSKSAELVVEEMVRLLRLNKLPADKASAKEQMTHLLMDRGYGDPLPSEQSLENWIKPFYSKS